MRVSLPDADAATVGAILMTHAEMQDQRITQTHEQIATMTNAQDIIAAQKHVTLLEDDITNLRRIARRFGDYA